MSQFSSLDVRNKYKSLWNDFVTLRIKLINGKLYRLFNKRLNMNNDIINEFYNECFDYENSYGIKLALGHRRINNKWCSIIENDRRNDIYKFIVIWNGVYEILMNVFNIFREYGVQRRLQLEKKNKKRKNKQNDKTEEKKNDSIDDSMKQLCLNIRKHICNGLIRRTNVFGDYNDDDDSESDDSESGDSESGDSESGDSESDDSESDDSESGSESDEDDSKQAGKSKSKSKLNSKKQLIKQSNENVYNLYTNLLYNNNFQELDKLIVHCINENISNINGWLDEEDIASNYQFQQFVVNEFAYTVFHDLTIDSLQNNNSGNNNNNNNSTKIELLYIFPKLLKMFKFIYNFSCYNYCHLRNSDYESFYMSQYFDLRYTLYKNIFGINTQDSKIVCSKVSKLNYYHNLNGDTLLHAVCDEDCRTYCQILIEDGFDINQSNSVGMTPYQIGQEENHEQILVLFRSIISDKDKENKNELSTSNMKSIQDLCDLVLKQIMFSEYFLLCLGIKNINDDVNINAKKHELRYDKHSNARDFMTDLLYRKLNELKRGLLVNDKEINGVNVMNGIVSVVMKLIDTKMVINDDLMILTWMYCNSNEKGELFVQHLLNCVTDCLSGKSEYKTRNYMYFKQYLLHSNIWYCNDSSKGDNKNNIKLLYDHVDNLADKLLLSQKKYIKNSIEKEEKQDSKNWDKLCNFNKYNNNNIQFRQDRIKNGIESAKSIKNAYITATKISNPDYNVFAEFNDKIYLVQCITFANENNEYFQSEIKKLFKIKKSGNDKEEYLFGLTKASIKEAPVKTYDRCLVKSSLVLLF